MTGVASPLLPDERPTFNRGFTWDKWVASLDVPVYRGYYIADLRTLELGFLRERQARTAVIQLTGQEGICETRVSEIPPGSSLEPTYFGLDELVYVLAGRGATSVSQEGGPSLQFEWQTHALFNLPRNTWRRLHNTSGTESVRLLHYNYLPLATSVLPDPGFFFHDHGVLSAQLALRGDALYAPAEMVEQPPEGPRMPAGVSTFWYGNFLPNMQAWDHLVASNRRGAGGRVVFFQFPDSEMTVHMSVFPSRTYKKAHRHGPGRAIVIPAGEGFSVMWEEGKDKVIVPWREGSMLTPPNRWFHQHFNTGPEPARYMALHPPRQFSGHSEKVQDRVRDQIEYPDEDPEIRARFEQELAEHHLTSLIPDEAYSNREYVWKTVVA